MNSTPTSGSDGTPSLAQREQIDRIADQFEREFDAGTYPAIEAWIERHRELHPHLFRELLALEIDLRQAKGEHLKRRQYQARFPKLVSIVDEVFQAIAQTALPDKGLRPTEAIGNSGVDRKWVGPFKILQPIGKGGMGQVYMAEQQTPVKRRVALKVIKTDTPTKEILARFEAERQALAMMDHQNIAKVLDAGITDDGRPYFAMELVKGIPITEYCDKNKLPPEERLQLFVQVCRAIQHAHQKGIIHRDLKPSNMLVTLYDGKPVAKVIDFGLAKALQDQTVLTARTLFTQYGQVVGTLEYMSPEQAEMNALDVDTRTDVYSLGVILYELLTGSTPIGRERLKSEAFDRILRIIREEEATRPSTRLSDSGDAITGISKLRRTDPKRLSLILKGDLDWIAIKALEKDRIRRYDGPAALADDIERFLDNEPIEARPPSISYRLQKMYRKNKASVMTGAAVLSLLLVGIAAMATLWLSFRAEEIALKQKNEVVRIIDRLLHSEGTGVQFAIEDLERFPRDFVVKELHQRYDDCGNSEKLALAHALAKFEKADVKFLVSAIATAGEGECDNIVASLTGSKDKAIQELQLTADTANVHYDWRLKTRLATVALHLGNCSIAAQMLKSGPARRNDGTFDRDWQDPKLDADWTKIPSGLKSSFDSAHGMLAERFAFCQKMAWEKFLEEIEILRSYGYRPARVRPFVHNNERFVAAIWSRDGLRWHLEPELSLDKLPTIYVPIEKDGMLLEDISSYSLRSGENAFALLWCERKMAGEQRILRVDMTFEKQGERDAIAKQYPVQQVVGLAELIGGPVHVGIWSNQGLENSIRFDVDFSRSLPEPMSQSVMDIRVDPIEFEDPLDLHRRSLKVIAEAPRLKTNLKTTRFQSAEANYYLNQPAQSLIELDQLEFVGDDSEMQNLLLGAFVEPSEIPTRLPELHEILHLRCLSFAKLGKINDARATFELFKRSCPITNSGNASVKYTEIVLHAIMGEADVAKSQLDQMISSDDADGTLLYYTACAAAQVSAVNLARNIADLAQQYENVALESLARAMKQGFVVKTRNSYARILVEDPKLIPLHSNPRFISLIRGSLPSRFMIQCPAENPRFQSFSSPDLNLDTQLEMSRRFVNDGYRPLAIVSYAKTDDAPLQSAIVWHRPTIEWDPVQRTSFIEDFAKWSGNQRLLIDAIQNLEEPDLMSGICLAIGNHINATMEEKNLWRPLFEQWYKAKPDGATHSASGWALRSWGFELPIIPFTRSPSSESNDWKAFKSGITMLRIPSGECFVSPADRDDTEAWNNDKFYSVSISEFWLADREVTWDLYKQFLIACPPSGDGGLFDIASHRQQKSKATDSHPFQERYLGNERAADFCNWLSSQEGLPPAYTDSRDPISGSTGFRLPSVYEWEYACRANSTTAFSFGNDPLKLNQYCVHNQTQPSKVGTRFCNSWGLFDMHGNVFELCDNYWKLDERFYNFPQMRGGDWNSNAHDCESKQVFNVSARYTIGFRVAQSQPK